jgi:hypothetical protein
MFDVDRLLFSHARDYLERTLNNNYSALLRFIIIITAAQALLIITAFNGKKR